MRTVRDLSEPERHLVADLRRRLVAELPGVGVRMTVFGSRARGDAEPDSDMDVLVELDVEHERLLEHGNCDFAISPLDRDLPAHPRGHRHARRPRVGARGRLAMGARGAVGRRGHDAGGPRSSRPLGGPGHAVAALLPERLAAPAKSRTQRPGIASAMDTRKDDHEVLKGAVAENAGKASRTTRRAPP